MPSSSLNVDLDAILHPYSELFFIHACMHDVGARRQMLYFLRLHQSIPSNFFVIFFGGN